MADIGMGGKIPDSVKIDKTKETERLDKKQAIKDRESMAGTQQAEAKYRKEEVTKTEGKYKAHKTAYEYLLGEEPEEKQVDEDWQSTPVEEEKEVIKLKAGPTLEEIEQYNVRKRFKAKVALLLGDDFDEDVPYEDEKIIVPEIRLEDARHKLELARHSFATLNQYINGAIGSFDFDNLEDINLLLDYGMPEDAIIKFIFLQQMARAGTDFPNVMDMSIIMYKFRKLGIDKTDDQVIDFIKNDYETLLKLKYTLAGFVYVPLHEVMVKIEEDLKDRYKEEFTNRLKKYNIEEYPDLSRKGSKTILDSLSDLVISKQKEIADILREKTFLTLKINQTALPKAKAELQEKLNILISKIEPIEKELSITELEVTKMIFIFSFNFAKQSIADYNRKYPIDSINFTLKKLKIRLDRKEIVNFIEQKVNVHSLKPMQQFKKEPLKKSIETFETKIKGAVLSVNKLPLPKQQQILKNIRNNTFEVNSDFYWRRQKNLDNILEYGNDIMESFDL